MGWGWWWRSDSWCNNRYLRACFKDSENNKIYLFENDDKINESDIDYDVDSDFDAMVSEDDD